MSFLVWTRSRLVFWDDSLVGLVPELGEMLIVKVKSI